MILTSTLSVSSSMKQNYKKNLHFHWSLLSPFLLFPFPSLKELFIIDDVRLCRSEKLTMLQVQTDQKHWERLLVYWNVSVEIKIPINVFITVQSRWWTWIYLVDKSVFGQPIKKSINNFKCIMEHFITLTYWLVNSVCREEKYLN